MDNGLSNHRVLAPFYATKALGLNRLDIRVKSRNSIFFIYSGISPYEVAPF
jgi:hypothetical protein